jgi:hypothetical protein
VAASLICAILGRCLSITAHCLTPNRTRPSSSKLLTSSYTIPNENVFARATFVAKLVPWRSDLWDCCPVSS